MSDKTYVRLKLQDLTIIDQFVCYSEYGMEAEPAHSVLIHAKGNYERNSDKLQLNGKEIQLDTIQISRVATKEDCLKSHARHAYISIYMIDHVFAEFLALLRSNTETGEITVKLDAQPLNEEMLRLSFDGMDMTRNAGVSITERAIAETHRASLSAQLQTIKTLLFAIAAMTGLILLHFLFR